VAGSVLGWNQAVLHWGAHAAHRTAAPRISLACAFQRGDVAPYGAPLFAPAPPPGFAQRQRLIGRQTLRYTHMMSADPRWSDLAEVVAG
jgi:hypothetical protein